MTAFSDSKNNRHPVQSRCGFVLLTVLIVTAIGLLFGAGALLLFRFQCQMRIERQHELEKVYAVRSVLNWLRPYNGELDEEGRYFVYHTGSGRRLELTAKPVAPIFPSTNENHFVMEKGHFAVPSRNQYIDTYDCEYGALGVTNLHLKGGADYYPIENNDGNTTNIYGLAFRDVVATNYVVNNVTNNVRWWVNIGMRNTGGWLQEDFGRRYMFWPQTYVDGEYLTKDIMRLCLIRDVSNTTHSVGCRYGWPLSSGERALVFEIVPKSGAADTGNAEMRLYEYECIGGEDDVIKSLRICFTNKPSQVTMGLQLAGDKVSLFYVPNDSENDKTVNLFAYGYEILTSTQMSSEMYRYFASGITTNMATGKVHAPDMRAVFEVEAASDRRPLSGTDKNSYCNFLTGFRVTPAYQYEVYVEYPARERATVAQKIGTYDRSGNGYTMITYDTHGTENKGFRKDERLVREGKK